MQDIEAGFGTALQRYFGVRDYPLTAFNAMRGMVNRLRAGILTADDDEAVEPMSYIAWKHYAKPSIDDMSDAYQEMIFHTGLSQYTSNPPVLCLCCIYSSLWRLIDPF